MSDVQLNLTGWKAIAAIIVVLGFVLFKYQTAYTSLNSEGAEKLKYWIAAEYHRYHLARNDIDEEEKAKMLLASSPDVIEFLSLNARGSLEDMIVRVKITPTEATPPNSNMTRYYRMKYSTLSGWRDKGSASEFSYHLAII